MTPPWAFMDGIGLAHRRAVGCRYARPGVFPGDGRRQKASGASGTPPPTWVGCPLTGSRANLRRGAGTPPYGCNSRKRGRGGYSLMGRSVGRGLDPSVGVCGRQGACPLPRGRGRACPARRFSRGWAAAEGFRGVGDAAPYVGGCPLTGGRANLRRGAVRRLLFFFQHWAGHTVENVSSLPGMDV